jgi:oxygen-dependent protoporphyrinogen oxidase
VTAPQVIVVGAGPSGLFAAFLLTQRGIDCLVIDPDGPGGKARTERIEGYLCEPGAHGFPDGRPELMALYRQAGLTAIAAADTARTRYLYFRGRLQPLPDSPGALARTPLLSPAAKLRLLLEPFARAAAPGREESVLEFARRRLGSEPAERLVAALVAGIFAGDAGQLSVAYALPRLYALEREHGSFARALLQNRRMGPGRLHSFRGGMRELMDGLAERIGGSLLRERARVVERAGVRFSVRTDRGTTVSADAVVVATPADQTAALLGVPALAEIPYLAVDVACLGYRRDDVPFDLAGYGFLSAPDETLPALGCLWESSLFPERAPAGHVLLRVFLGGARRPELAASPEGEVERAARRALELAMGITAPPRLQRLFRHPRGIPQYTIGHGARVAAAERLEREQPGLFLTGNALRGVGIADCAADASRLLNRVQQRLGGTVHE